MRLVSVNPGQDVDRVVDHGFDLIDYAWDLRWSALQLLASTA
jgi:hypothetical protein